MSKFSFRKSRKRRDDNKLENKLSSYFQAIKKRFIKIEDHLIELSNPKSTIGNVPHHNFDTDLLRKPDFWTGKQTFWKECNNRFFNLTIQY